MLEREKRGRGKRWGRKMNKCLFRHNLINNEAMVNVLEHEKRWRNAGDRCRCADEYEGDNCDKIIKCKNDGEIVEGRCSLFYIFFHFF